MGLSTLCFSALWGYLLYVFFGSIGLSALWVRPLYGVISSMGLSALWSYQLYRLISNVLLSAPCSNWLHIPRMQKCPAGQSHKKLSSCKIPNRAYVSAIFQKDNQSAHDLVLQSCLSALLHARCSARCVTVHRCYRIRDMVHCLRYGSECRLESGDPEG